MLRYQNFDLSWVLCCLISCVISLGASRIEADVTNVDLKNLFRDAVHTREGCSSDFKPCQIPLQKRTDDFYIRIVGEQEFNSKSVANAALQALQDTIPTIESATGHSAIWSSPSQPVSNFIFLIFVNEEILDSDPNAFISERVAPNTLEFRESRLRFFELFLRSDQNCSYYSVVSGDGIIRDAQIWVKVNISPAEMARCVAEEIYNSFGLDDGPNYPSIFDWPGSNESVSQDSRLDKLSAIHIRFLRMLYHPEMLTNQLVSRTSEKIEEWSENGEFFEQTDK